MIAWLLGWTAGYAVVLFAGGKKGQPLQIIAVVSSCLGILFGKYIIYYYSYKDYFINESGEEAAKDISLFSDELFIDFIKKHR